MGAGLSNSNFALTSSLQYLSEVGTVVMPVIAVETESQRHYVIVKVTG